ncbi:MAG: hypothetical protein NC120_07945 [Ruminococcus sp.]|nr:hypothetical protein [Ruminococcus sp.]
MEVDGNGIPIVKKEKYIIKITDFTKKIKNIKINKPYKILTASEAGMIKLIDLNVKADDIIFIIGTYSISPKIKIGTHLTFMEVNSNKIICHGDVINEC